MKDWKCKCPKCDKHTFNTFFPDDAPSYCECGSSTVLVIDFNKGILKCFKCGKIRNTTKEMELWRFLNNKEE